MERENHINSELTGQAQNTYSNERGINMPESGENPQNSPDQGVPRTHEQIQADVEAWENSVRARGEQITPDMREAFRTMARSGFNPSNVGSSEPPRPDNVDINEGLANLIGEKVRVGVEAAFSKGRGEREIERPDSIDTNEISDSILQSIAEDINQAITSEKFLRDRELLGDLAKDIQDRVLQQPGLAEQARQLEDRLRGMEGMINAYEKSVKAGTRDTLRLYLTTDDFERLEADPMAWIREELDKIYELSAEGQELDSQLLRDAQQRQGIASRYLVKINASKDLSRKFDTEFLTKLNVMYARSTVQQKNMEGIQTLATKLTTHGILDTLSFEEGMVGMMHNRIQELYDDVRVRLEEHHITSEEHSRIQSKVIDEFTALISRDKSLADKIIGNGNVSEFRKNEQIRNAVVRAVRTGYDHFVASQREAVIVARGEALPTEADLEGIIADPSQLFNIFNYEQLLIEKYKLLNHEQQEYFDALKRRYAESVLYSKKKPIREFVQERLKSDPSLKNHKNVREAALIAYGTELMRDLLAVNDFYSSGWRIEKFTTQINEIMRYKTAEAKFANENRQEYDRLRAIIDSAGITNEAYKKKTEAQRLYSRQVGLRMNGFTQKELANIKERSETFGLFMRLRGIKAHSFGEIDADKEYKKTWQNIANFRPEDVVKIFREKGNQDELKTVNAAFNKLGLTASNGMTLYDAFKDEYGAVIRMVREKGFSDNILPEQIDFSQINSNSHYSKYKDLLINYLSNSNDPSSISEAKNKVAKIEEVYKAMKSFAEDKETIKSLMTDTRFEYLYIRTYTVDDVLLDKMENVDLSVGITQVSKKLDPEAAGNAYRRTFNDAQNATEAQTQFFTFLRSEKLEDKLKSALAAGEAASHYGGPNIRATAFRYLFGSHILMGQVADGGWLSKGMLLEIADMKNVPGHRPANELQRIFGYQAPAYNNDEMVKFLEEYRGDFVKHSDNKKDAEALWHEMRRLAKARPRDKARFLTIRGLIYMMLYLALEGSVILKEGLEPPEELN